MAKARVGAFFTGLMLAAGAWPASLPASAQSRFISYGSESQCLAGHILTAAVCRSAFANARAEFEAKTPSFSSLQQCAKAFGTCAPWPSGSKLRPVFRPQWGGVDIVDTPREKSVTPARLNGRTRLSFAPQPLTGPAEGTRELTVRPSRPTFAGRFGPPAAVGNARSQHVVRATGPERSPEPSAPPPPGSGFKMENGVLTFPAPARYAPKNLPKLQ